MDQTMKQDQVPQLKPIKSSQANGDEQTNQVGTKGFAYACELSKRELQMVCTELFILYEIVWPVVVTGILLYSRNQVSMLFLGRLGTAQLAGGSIANAFANITGYSVLKGLSSGMEPICGQAYGARQWPILSQTVQKTILLLLVVAIPISLLWIYMEPILLFFYQKPEILAPAKEYILFSLPDLFAQAFLHPVRIFLRTQNITRPVSVCATAGLVLHVPISYFLVFYMGLGVKGVALASSLNTININLGLIGYMIFSKSCLKPWTGSLVPGLKGWVQLIRLAIPSCIGVCLEWWWYEVMMVVCGWLVDPKASVASFGILIQMTSLIYVFPSSLGLGLSTRVAHELGAGRPTQARLASAVGIVVSMICGIVSCLFAVSVKDVWGTMFNNDSSILHLTAVALPIIGMCEIGNSPQTVGCGVLRGSAKPAIGAHINFAAFYLVGLPVSLLCAFPFKMGFVGLLMGLLAAQASCACFMLYAINNIDWEAQAEKARNFSESSRENSDLEASLIVSECKV
ncbi:Protein DETOXIFICATION [Rhynchospora pubera]|uniref:Protein DETOXIFICATION n=1 Tax=Rhynchospora pubera TaxID=906938 RepID=A0AAV8GHG2_9POAL|nr:Protein DETOXIFICATION [Rhynchospora pubera]